MSSPVLLDDTVLDLWGAGPNRAPIDTHHLTVRTHPVTGLKALNINPGFVTAFAELKEKESGTSSLLFYATFPASVLMMDRQASRLLRLPHTLRW